jgi:lysozyme family protein
MAKENFGRCLELVLQHEGGFVDHPADPGGATNKGITIKTYRSFFGEDKTVEDLKNIKDSEVATIYRNGYWDKVCGDMLPLGLDYVVFDAAVNSGPRRSVIWLQQALNTSVDGHIGDETIGKALSYIDPDFLITATCDNRLDFLHSLKAWDTFGKGWGKRVLAVKALALKMNDSSPSVQNYEIVKVGSVGEWAYKVKEALYGNTSCDFDNNFTTFDEESLKRFQGSVGLVVDGVAGKNTLRALGLIM